MYALENRIPIVAPNVCGDNSSNNTSTYKGKSIYVDFDYDYKTDIAIPKLRFTSSVNKSELPIYLGRRIARNRVYQGERRYKPNQRQVGLEER
jgi:hypothetical protein